MGCKIVERQVLILIQNVLTTLKNYYNAIVFRFLRILQLIIQEPGTAFKTFLPSTINLCMEHIYPLLAEVCCVVAVESLIPKT